jgi:hypothetical protein
MTEKDLANALLRGETPIDIEALTQRILRRDRRRIWILGTICVIAWMAVVMIPWATVLPMVAKLGHQELYPATMPFKGMDREQSLALLRVLKAGTVATFLDSIACMFVAAVCTVSLIILSRRATLRQVNVRLAEISAQLKAPLGKP